MPGGFFLVFLLQMISDEVKRKLQDIICGNELEGAKDPCTTARNYLCSRFGTSRAVKEEFQSKSLIKEEQVALLKSYARDNGLWLATLPHNSQYLTRGGESLIYLTDSTRHVLKVNDAVYYATWGEYLDSLMLHNIFFPNTAYSLTGFMEHEHELCAVLQQPYVQGGQASLDDISDYMAFNGFEHRRRQDYFNAEFGLLLEDMHDENVIEKDGTLFVIDSVFYLQ